MQVYPELQSSQRGKPRITNFPLPHPMACRPVEGHDLSRGVRVHPRKGKLRRKVYAARSRCSSSVLTSYGIIKEKDPDTTNAHQFENQHHQPRVAVHSQTTSKFHGQPPGRNLCSFLTCSLRQEPHSRTSAPGFEPTPALLWHHPLWLGPNRGAWAGITTQEEWSPPQQTLARPHSQKVGRIGDARSGSRESRWHWTRGRCCILQQSRQTRKGDSWSCARILSRGVYSLPFC